MFNKYQLDNKADVYLVPQSGVESLTVMVMCPVGSRNEPKHLFGSSHLIEHMMFKGTDKRPSTLDITKEIDKFGADYNAFTGKEYTGYYIKIDSTYNEIAIDILSDVLFNSKFNKEEIEKEKGVILEEIKMYEDNPAMDINNVFGSLMYDGSNLGRDIAGSPEDVKGLKRKKMLKYKNKYYQPENMSIVVAGDVNNEVRENIDNYFDSYNNKEDIETQEFDEAEFGPDKKENRIKIKRKESKQAQLMLGFPAFDYTDERNSALTVINRILGGTMSSRLFTRIREQLGLAYSVSTGVNCYQDVGHFFIKVGLDSDNINKAITEIRNEISKIKEGIKKEEIESAKTNIKGRLTLRMEDSSSRASWFAKRSVYEDAITTPEQRIEEVEAVTQKEIDQVTTEVFDWNQARIAIIGETKQEDINF